MNRRQSSAMTANFNPVNHVKSEMGRSIESVGKAIQYLDLTMARPEGFEPPTLCLEVKF